jgi:hypothetical protein
MKRYLFILLVYLQASCTPPASQNSESVDAEPLAEFDWLLGEWVRVNEKEDLETFENWSKKNDTEYVGLGFTLQNRDTVWQEKIHLVKSTEEWNYEVSGKGDTIATKFLLTTIGKGEFICENENNEFPKKIRFSKNGKGITAVISGGDMEIPFEFERVVKE